MRLPPLRRAAKRLLPTSLFARALLIMLVPLFALQGMVAYIFYERHWDSVVRNMSGAVAAEIAFMTGEFGGAESLPRLQSMGRQLNFTITHRDDGGHSVIEGRGRSRYTELYDTLSDRIRRPLMIDDHGSRVRLSIGLDRGTLVFEFGRKRLASSTTSIFILWMMGSALLLMLIAILFLRNQIRPIVQLARAAEQFGRGQEVAEVSSRGANEIKRAATAFRIMADRIRRSIGSRTEMLAGISHDLRTPLTRMKLEIEMGTIDTATRDALEADIEEMRRMIDEYLDFARGDAGEPVEVTDLAALTAELVESYARQRRPVSLGVCEAATLSVRPQALRRALTNLIDNALRYGRRATIDLEQTMAFVRLRVIDAGPGIPEADHETVFKPFTRLESSRNIKTGGVGLGLSIARDIAQSHGGSITLENQKNRDGTITGLAVTLRLPREVNG
jgi:two-component system osmolarity sensor histidine kinase EnvZ